MEYREISRIWTLWSSTARDAFTLPSWAEIRKYADLLDVDLTALRDGWYGGTRQTGKNYGVQFFPHPQLMDLVRLIVQDKKMSLEQSRRTSLVHETQVGAGSSRIAASVQKMLKGPWLSLYRQSLQTRLTSQQRKELAYSVALAVWMILFMAQNASSWVNTEVGRAANAAQLAGFLLVILLMLA